MSTFNVVPQQSHIERSVQVGSKVHLALDPCVIISTSHSLKSFLMQFLQSAVIPQTSSASLQTCLSVRLRARALLNIIV
jgi:hypothetical protein